ncbi:diacylglycerol kinase family protein [Halioxenophilus sp. WMMB6]|uniref:diacylglycerol kinase family protein n=1 Tax=Halioxenophilus sp. WMMB6 TaxID=3073815 RepID=UPI00295E7CC7|nr:diacylglycerol kinase family protein [Halioxenophilus sp. WMMB6]
MPTSFSFGSRLKSVGYAAAGIVELVLSQHNAWIHLIATLMVVLAGLFFGVKQLEWCLLVFAIMAVWLAEGLNTALEFLCDAVTHDFHPLIKKSKDVAAGSVLLTAMGAVIVGLIIFLPYLSASL